MGSEQRGEMKMPKINVDISKLSAQDRSSKRYCLKTDTARNIEALRLRCELLKPADRAIMKMYLENGFNYSGIARLLRISQSSVSRRIKKNIHKLVHGEYIFCLKNRRSFTQRELKILRDYYMAEMSQFDTARQNKITRYQLVKLINKVNRLRTMNFKKVNKGK